jgi:hypothetical protein
MRKIYFRMFSCLNQAKKVANSNDKTESLLLEWPGQKWLRKTAV